MADRKDKQLAVNIAIPLLSNPESAFSYHPKQKGYPASSKHVYLQRSLYNKVSSLTTIQAGTDKAKPTQMQVVKIMKINRTSEEIANLDLTQPRDRLGNTRKKKN